MRAHRANALSERLATIPWTGPLAASVVMTNGHQSRYTGRNAKHTLIFVMAESRISPAACDKLLARRHCHVSNCWPQAIAMRAILQLPQSPLATRSLPRSETAEVSFRGEANL